MGIEMSRAIALLFLFATGICSAASPGMISMNIGGETRLYSMQKIAPEDSVFFQYPDKTGATRCCIKRAGKSFELVGPDALASDAVNGEPAFRYRLVHRVGMSYKAPFFGVAVVGNLTKIEQAADKSLKVNLPDGVLTVRSCTSLEGLHALGEAGSRRVSDLYLGFDYSVEHPTCTE